jgi:hypothetical protein
MNSEQACQRGQAMSRPKKKDQRQGQGTGVFVPEGLTLPTLIGDVPKRKEKRAQSARQEKGNVRGIAHSPGQ